LGCFAVTGNATPIAINQITATHAVCALRMRTSSPARQVAPLTPKPEKLHSKPAH